MAMQSDMKRRFKYNSKENNDSMDSNRSKPIGTRKTFKEIRESQIESETNKLLLEFWIDITVLIIIVILLLVDKHKNSGCGIPIREWIIFFFVIWLSKSALNLNKIWVMRRYYHNRVSFSVMFFVIMNGLLVIWLFYGYFLYYSPQNDCGNNQDTAFLNSLMFVILIIGYFVITIYFVLLLILPLIYCCIQDYYKKSEEDREQKSALVSSIQKTSFDP